MNDRHHEMVLEKIHLSGVEEWSCPVCGRRFLVQWPPAYKIIILEPGDQDTRHNLSRAHHRISRLLVTEAESTDVSDDFRLLPWKRWMEKVDFDSMWGNPLTPGAET